MSFFVSYMCYSISNGSIIALKFTLAEVYGSYYGFDGDFLRIVLIYVLNV